MRKITFSVMAVVLLYGTQVFSAAVNEMLIVNENNTTASKVESDADKMKLEAARKTARHPWETTYKKPVITPKDPKNYPKTTH